MLTRLGVETPFSPLLTHHKWIPHLVLTKNPPQKLKEDALLYPAYGQIIESPFDLSLLGLMPGRYSGAKPRPNIRITQSHGNKPFLGHVNNQTAVNSHYGYYYREGVAFYEFIQGKEIRVSPLTNNFDVDFVRILLNYPMACLLYQQGYFLLHASAVAFRDKVFLFPGPSLCGKSTIAAYLVKNGGKLITEDTAAIAITDKGVFISPSYPLIKISAPANKYIALTKSKGVTFPQDNNARRGHFITSASFLKDPAKIDFCIFPEWSSNSALLEKSSFSLSLGKLLAASLSIYPLDKTKEKHLLAANAKFLRNVDAYIYKRGKSFSSLESLTKDLEAIQRNSA